MIFFKAFLCLFIHKQMSSPNILDAAKAGDIESLQHMMSSPDFEWHPDTTSFAAQYGHLEFLKFAHKHGCPWGFHTCACAAFGGHLDCLKFAYEHGAPLRSFTLNEAITNSHFEYIKYVCEKGYPVSNIHSCLAAARSLECLKYLYSISCPMNFYTSIYAAKEYQLDCLQFALENGCPFGSFTCVSLNKHSEKIDLDKHIWLRNQLFSLIESGELIPRDDCRDLYGKVQAKIEEIKLQKQFAFIECNELPSELVNFIISDYF
jgi:hypothetical protein